MKFVRDKAHCKHESDTIVTLFVGDITETGNYPINGNYSDFKFLIFEGSTSVESAASRVVTPGYKIIGDASNYVQFGIEGYLSNEHYLRYNGLENSKQIGISTINNVHIRRIKGIK